MDTRTGPKIRTGPDQLRGLDFSVRICLVRSVVRIFWSWFSWSGPWSGFFDSAVQVSLLTISLIHVLILKSFYSHWQSFRQRGNLSVVWTGFLSVQIYGLVNGAKMLIFLDYWKLNNLLSQVNQSGLSVFYFYNFLSFGCRIEIVLKPIPFVLFNNSISIICLLDNLVRPPFKIEPGVWTF